MSLVLALVAAALLPGARARGCFAPQTLVTLADGERLPIANISVGARVQSWDESQGRGAVATVLAVTRVWNDEVMDVLLEDGTTRITSTLDHPYWSHASGRIVSADPAATREDYGLEAAMIGGNETFADAEGRPVRGSVLLRPPWSGAAASARRLRGGGSHELFTLCLDAHHWFFAHGIRVHNKGGCFLPETLVSLGSGARVPMSSVSEGDSILSWDPEKQELANATVKVVQRALADELVDVVLEGSGERITSTPDHPYWSHGKQAIVSRDPQATQADYGIAVSMMDDLETFAGEGGQPIRATAAPRPVERERGLLLSDAERRGALRPEVITFCLDRFHWYFVHGVRVHNKGCFVPSTAVTLGDGSRKPIGSISEGDVVRSWDEHRQAAANATVMSVVRRTSSALVDVLLHDGATRVTSTPDHPYWSHAQGRIVSMDPRTTEADYDLPAGLMRDAEVFADEDGRPLPARVQRNATALRKLTPAAPQEVITLCLDQHHWFFVHGARVHNKGGCFVPGTPVTLGDGSRKAISGIREGDIVRSWDEEQQLASTATVVSVVRHHSDDLMEVLLGGGSARITSTPDHPYWSHRRGGIVSRYPNATSAEYGLSALMMADVETFADETGKPVQGLVRHGNASGESALRQLRSASAASAEVITLCLDRHHWFFVQGVRVHNKGCFVPSSPVTLGDGRRQAIGALRPGDVVLSWDEASRRAINATVASVVRANATALADVFVRDGEVRITSTPDHPYWSERQQRIVSLDPDATSLDYGLPAGLALSEELFADADGRPVSGLVKARRPAETGPLAVRMLGEEGEDLHCLRGEVCEVVTLTLEGSHWFFVHGIRVHNKYGSSDSGHYCCCAAGFHWNPQIRKCEPCPQPGLLNGGQECFEKCGKRSGACPFCGKTGKCCRSMWHEPGAVIGPGGCGEYEGGDDKHVCVGEADEDVPHPLAHCWNACGMRGGKCDFCGEEGFCCRANFTTPADIVGEGSCAQGEGDPRDHVCINRGSLSCDGPDIIMESYYWMWCDRFPQTRCDYKDKTAFCCCDKGYQWDGATQRCVRCAGSLSWVQGGYLQGTAADACSGATIINTTGNDGLCPPSLHLHECTAPFWSGGSFISDFWILGVMLGICACGCFKDCCYDRLVAARFQNRATRCREKGCRLRLTSCRERALVDRTYNEGWYCDLCNRYTNYSETMFARCDDCEVDFCAACQPWASASEVQMTGAAPLQNMAPGGQLGQLQNWVGGPNRYQQLPTD